MRVSLVSVGSLIVLAGCQAPSGRPDYSAVFDGSGGRWIDLSYAFSEETIYWPTEDGFRLDELAYGETEAGYFYSSYKISTAEHGGTHLDAPIHFFRGGMSTAQIPLDRLIAPVVVVDVSARATPDYRIEVADLEAWERAHGRIPDGAILLLRTGWESAGPTGSATWERSAPGRRPSPNSTFPAFTRMRPAGLPINATSLPWASTPPASTMASLRVRGPRDHLWCQHSWVRERGQPP